MRTALCLLLLCLVTACEPSDPIAANPALGRELAGEWVFAGMELIGEHNTLTNTLMDFAQDAFGDDSAHYTFQLDGTYTVRVWAHAARQMEPAGTGRWYLNDDGQSLDLRFRRRHRGAFQIVLHANRLELHALHTNGEPKNLRLNFHRVGGQ